MRIVVLVCAFFVSGTWLSAQAVSSPAPAAGSTVQPPASTGGQNIATSKPDVPDTSIVPPKLIYQPQPEFSKKARKQHRGGIVEISMLVDETGSPTDVKVTKSASPDLDEQALKAVRQYRFEPALKDGKPVAKTIHIEVNFEIVDGLSR